MKHKEAPVCLFLLFALVVVLHHLFGYLGHFGYDDLLYARIAKNWIDGQALYDNAFSYRFTIIAFTAFSYLMLGVNDLASALPSMVVSIAILFVVYRLLKREGALQTLLGLTMTLGVQVFLFYTDKLMPDIYVALFILLALFWYNQHRFGPGGNAVWYASLFSLSWFLAFSSKETAVLFLPLTVVLCITDLILKRNLTFWFSVLISGLLIAAAYLAVIRMLTGDFLTRFDLLAANNQSQTFVYSYDKLPTSFLLNRISYELLAAYLKEGMLVSIALVITALLFKDFRKAFYVNDTYGLFMVASVVLLLSVNFMSVSPFSYHPVPTEARHSLFIIPIAAIAASFAIREYLTEHKLRYHLPVMFMVVSILAIFIDRSTAFLLYIPLTLIFTSYPFIRKRNSMKILFASLFLMVLFIKPAIFFHHSASSVNYRLQKKIVFDHFIRPGQPCYVFTDPVQRSIGDYYNGFDTTRNCRFVDFTKPGQHSFDTTLKKYLYLNWHTQYYSKSYDKLPYFARNIDSAARLVHENRRLGIYVYELQHVFQPETDGVKLLETRNDFEADYPHWTSGNSTVVTLREQNGNKVSKPGEYSAVFSIPLDSLTGSGPANLYVKCRFMCYFRAAPKSHLVLSVVNQGGTITWEGKELTRPLAAISPWENFHFDFIIDKVHLKPGNIMKIYLWNPNGDIAYIDDFEITIYRAN